MWLTWIVSLLGGTMAALFAVASLTCGLLYASELIEEHSVLTGRVLLWTVRVVIGLHVVLMLDGVFPISSLACGIGCHGTYYLLLGDYPNIDPSSPVAIFAFIAFIVDHYVWFGNVAEAARVFSFFNLIGAFVVFVWLVPVGCFLSLSVNDLTLPTSRRRESPSLFRQLFDAVAAAAGSLRRSRRD